MKLSKNRCSFWGALSVLSFLADTFPFLNLWAAIDLGYDGSPRGREIIARWSYAMLGLMACGVLFAALAIRAWWASRKLEKPPAEKGR
jgi:hypothetical protein